MMSSLFTSASTQLAARIETMRQAEGALISFSKRFGAIKTMDDTESHSFQLFDTKIPRHVVPLKGKKNGNVKCQLNLCGNDDSGNDDDSLIMHGIEVTSNAYEPPSDGTDEPPLVLLHG